DPGAWRHPDPRRALPQRPVPEQRNRVALRSHCEARQRRAVGISECSGCDPTHGVAPRGAKGVHAHAWLPGSRRSRGSAFRPKQPLDEVSESAMSSALRTVIIDADDSARAEVRRVLTGLSSIVVTAEYKDVSQCLLAAPAHHADVLLVGISEDATPIDRLA